MEFVQYILNLVLVVPIVIILFFIAVKLGKTSLSKVGIHNHISILEKVNLSKDSSMFVLKMGEKEGCVGILSPSGFQIIQNLDSEIFNKKNNNIEENYIDLLKKEDVEL